MRVLWWAGLGLLLLQLGGLLGQSAYLYGHFDLTSDFALFDQAWVAIAHGHLDPEGTLYRTAPFLTNHFELITYPLALLWFVFPHGITLLVVQDVATVAGEAVAFAWVLDLVSSGERETSALATSSGTVRRRDVVLATGALVVLVADPWIWWADAFDFHLQALAAVFALLAARGFWSKRGHPWIWVVLALSCGAVESIVLVGLAVTLLVARRGLWREGAALLAIGVAWVAVLSGLGLDTGSQLSTNYGYLAHVKPGATVTLSAVIAGVLEHPSTALRTVASRWRDVWHFVAGSSLLGVATTIGLPVSIVILLPSVLNHSPTVISPIASYQELAVFLFVPVGSFVAMRWVLARRSAWVAVVGVLVGAAALAQVVSLSARFAPEARAKFAKIPPASASVLANVLAHTPADAEVVASNGVVGRFAGRLWVYSYLGATPGGKVVLVREREVLFVLVPRQGFVVATAEQTLRLARFVRVHLGAIPVAHADGIYAYLWHPGPGVRSVTLPSAP
ncbi:DUF2079 domain-containing protein [Haloactinopolyspora sp.]|uniref:DUF2079 domain-containing protein n=1 Tax=Haloactinopolyspora sp. TaxID=1966353 RepID=UPI00261149E3|nr:DUF2079 domain-containing protein [Haloactinopolyspora sp.]